MAERPFWDRDALRAILCSCAKSFVKDAISSVTPFESGSGRGKILGALNLVFKIPMVFSASCFSSGPEPMIVRMRGKTICGVCGLSGRSLMNVSTKSSTRILKWVASRCSPDTKESRITVCLASLNKATHQLCFCLHHEI